MENRLEKLLTLLKEKGSRITPQRHAILTELLRSECHPSAEDIFRELSPRYPTMSLATVYKTLNLLKTEQEVLELEFSEMPNRYDGRNPGPHPHAVCTGCGKIIDPPTFDMRAITAKIAQDTGFIITGHRLDFFGLCDECQKKKE